MLIQNMKFIQQYARREFTRSDLDSTAADINKEPYLRSYLNNANQ